MREHEQSIFGEPHGEGGRREPLLFGKTLIGEMTLELIDEEHRGGGSPLRRSIEEDRFPLAPLKAMLAKLQPTEAPAGTGGG